MRFQLLFLILLSHTYLALGQTLPTAPNKRNAQGQRIGEWVMYYTQNRKETTLQDSIAFYRKIDFDVTGKPTGKTRDYYRNGALQFEGMLLQIEPEKIVDGSCVWYHLNGIKSKEAIIDKGEVQKVKTWYENGKPECQYALKNGQLEGLVRFWNEKGDSTKLYFEDGQRFELKTLNQEVMKLYQTSKYAQAIPIAEKCRKIALLTLGEAHPSYALSLNNLALLYSDQGQYVKAEPLYVQALAITKKARGEDHPDYALSLNNLAALYHNQGLYIKAEPYLLQALAIRKKARGEDHPDYALSLNNLAALYHNQGLYTEAEPYFVQALAITKKARGEDHPDYALSLNNLAGLYKSRGWYSKAEPYFVQALAITKKARGEDHPDYAQSLNNLAVLYESQGRYTKADSLYVQALAIRKKALGEDHPDYAGSLNNLAALYKSQGLYTKAEPYFVQALAITKKAHGEDHPSYALSLNNLAVLYSAQGHYGKAESLYMQALTIRKKALGVDHPDYAGSLNNLAVLYGSQGQYVKAESLYMQASRIYKKALGEAHPDYAQSLNNLAALYRSQGQYSKAEPLYVQALAIRKKALGEDHTSYALSLNNLAGLYKSRGWYSKAEPYLLQALAVTKKALGEDHISYALSLNNLAVLYESQGHYDKAEPYLLQALAIRKKALGEAYPDYAQSLNNLAALYESQGRYSKAEPFYLQSIQIERNNLLTFFETAGPQQQEAYFRKNEFHFELNNSVALDYSTPNLLKDSYQNALLTKGLQLQTGLQLENHLRQSKDTSLVRRYRDYLDLRRMLNVQMSKPINQRYGVRELENEIEILYKDLARNSAEFRNFKANFQLTHQDIQKQLQPNEAAIEFVHFQYHNGKRWTDSTYYAALVLRRGWPAPRIVKLFEERQLRRLLQDTTQADDVFKVAQLYRGAEVVNQPQTADNVLYQLIWEPLDSLLGGVKTIHYSPSGLLHRLSMSAIPMPNGQLLHDKYTLHYLTSTRNLALNEPAFKLNPAQRIALFGDVRYYADSVSIKAAIKTKPKPQEEVAQISYNHYGKDRGSRGKEWVQLEGAANEIKDISQLCQKAKLNTTLYTNYVASEENLKALADTGKVSPQVLHIATHGFFYADSAQQKAAERDRSLRGEQQVRYAANPLERSGLVLAGANHFWKSGNPYIGLDDGILLASEVATLNLINTQLVVLSACETGLGDINGSEGVFGLQRAFKMAGVKYILMSLWQVPDEKTAEMMKEFYGNLLKPQPIETAFRNAQNTLRKKTNYSVYDWAGFVLIK